MGNQRAESREGRLGISGGLAMALHPAQRPCPEHDLSTRTDREFSYRVPFTESGRGVIDEVYPLIWLSPAWLFWIPFQILQFAGAVRAQVGLTWGDWLCYGLLFAVFVLCLATLVICLDHELEISITGLRAPLRFLPALSLRCFRRWHDLSAMRLREVPKKTGMARTLQFVFASGGAFSLEVEGISREDLKKLVLSVQTYSPAAEISNLLPDLDLGIPLDGSSCDATSFTKLWDDEFARRFGSTLFVPREAGSELQAGNLKIIRQLAFGGLSATYLAVRRDGQMVVLKESAVPEHADPKLKAKAEELFRREATLLGRINHQNIARCLDYFIEDGRHYLVLEYVGGQALRLFVTDNGPHPEDIAFRWAIETCEILVYLHGLAPPIVHRDLTPDNLVL